MDTVAIIGLSCLFPGADGQEAFWQVLTGEHNTTSAATSLEMGVDPVHFHDASRQNLDSSYNLRGGYIGRYAFDPQGYNLPAESLTALDSLYHWALHVSKMALKDSGYLDSLSVRAKTGVILGNLSFPTRNSTRLFAPIYDELVNAAVNDLLGVEGFTLPLIGAQAEARLEDGYSPGYSAAVVAAALGLNGTHFAIDAACASSLYSVALASKYLISGKADLMLAGAVSAADPLYVNIGFAHLGGYPDPKDGTDSRPLDSSSGGLTSGEGAGAFVLKRYADAVRDGDHIYALVRGVGLSNDGKGKHILTPNIKGQLTALERAYQRAGLRPQDVDYVECHASGTPKGDSTELSTMEQFFGNPPPLGSVKSNVGHLLTAAGMSSMIKLILSMKNGQIPPTIGVEEPLTAQLITRAQAWPASPDEPRRAGANAFGFGGVSAHIILEEYKKQPVEQHTPHNKNTRMAIIGMDAHFGSLDGLDAFGRSIYDGETAFRPLPETRWKGLDQYPAVLQHFGLDHVPDGAYIAEFALDFMKFGIPPNPNDQPISQQLLILKTADNAIRDAGLSESSNVAVLVALGTELALHRYRGRADLNWQVKQALEDAGIQLSAEQAEMLKTIAKDALLSPAKVNHYTSYIGNIAASRVAAHWDFSGPSFTISAEENSVFKALEVAQLMLADGEVDAVVVGAVDLAGGIESVVMRNTRSPLHQGKPTAGLDVNSTGWMVGEGAGAVVLTRADQPASKVYAYIDAVALVQEPSHAGQFPDTPSAQTVAQAAQKALSAAAVTPEHIGYLEFSGSGIAVEDEAEINGITSVYRGDDLSCAIGSVKANIGHTYAASGMASLIKTALCVAQRFLPVIPNWDSPKFEQQWQGTPFFVAPKSRTWFDKKRVAAISSLGVDGVAAHVVLSSAEQPALDNTYLAGGSPYLLPITGHNAGELDAKLAELQGLLDKKALAVLADEVFADYVASSTATQYVISIVGRNVADVRKQVEQARSAVADAIANGTTWTTPAGSYFAARPVGKGGKVAFVYPGAFNSYPKLGYELLHLFPQTYDALAGVKSDVGEAVAERLLYPRSLAKPTAKLTREMKNALLDDAVAIITSGLSFALLYTRIMRDTFNVQPDNAFGYSLGEGSMMWGMGVWTDGDKGSDAFKSSNLFHERLFGPMNAIREVWGIPADVPSDQFWAAHFIAGPVDVVREAVGKEDKVYLTHVNTPNECMIAGDPAACERVLAMVQGETMRAPFSVVIHNEATLGEYDEYYRLHNLPTHPVDGVTFYSAADYTPIEIDQHVIASSIARMACQQIDFTHLIDRAYSDGVRVFIELGPRSTCARWIDETLGNREHVAVSIDNMGSDARTSIVKMLAQLVSHRIPMDIAALYRPLATTNGRQLIRTVTLGGEDIYALITDADNKAQFTNIVQDYVPRKGAASMTTPSPNRFTALPADMSNVHADFLRSRQDALRQMSELISAQMTAMQGGVVQATLAPQASMLAPQVTLPAIPAPTPAPAPSVRMEKPPQYPQIKVETFATGRVADCFGDLYTIYDNVRAPRIPNGDLLLMTRVLEIKGERFKSQAGTSIHSEYDVPVDAWFYRDSPYPVMPYSVYMEIALQPCGFLSAYHGPTLEFPDIDFYFRNLDGQGKLYKDVDMRGRTITNHVTMVNSTVMSGIIIQKFTFACYDGDDLFYEGDATFGYFTLKALDSQAGLDTGKEAPRWIDTVELTPSQVINVNPHGPVGRDYLKLGVGQLEFTDEIKIVPDGGKYGQGYAYAHTIIDPQSWFFFCHFYQDPVMPGSIGVETIMQAMQAFVIETGLADDFKHPRFAQTDGEHNIVWKYRGQILSNSEKSHVEANIKRIERQDGKLTIYADTSLWRDKLRIYEIKDVALSVVEA